MIDFPKWTLGPGEYLSRHDRSKEFGGAKYGGIEPSAKTPNVFIYSDPKSGENYGYKYDGWNHDGSVYLYTGEGRIGDQKLKDGNSAVANHLQEGRSLRLFIADGEEDGNTKAKKQLYIGEFKVDPELPYYMAEAPDFEAETRTVFVFRLIPVGNVIRRKEDKSKESDPDDRSTSQLIELESLIKETFDQNPKKGVTAQRTESQLVERYKDFLESNGNVVKRWKLLPPGEINPLLTDLFDVTNNELYEAKGSITRNQIRLAVGQLLDYQRLLDKPPERLTVLLPQEPSSDLKKYIDSCGMSCIWETSPGNFIRL